jgi:NitT/TauT family transport system permease protein
MVSVTTAPRTMAPRRVTRTRRNTSERVVTTSVFIGSLVAIVLIWWAIVRFGSLPSYELPSPSSVWKALWSGITTTDSSSLLYQFSITFKAAMIGLIVGGVAGVIIGGIAAQFKALERLLMPYVFAIQTMPKVAIAPLLMIWFGFGQSTETILAGLLAFFPLVVNTFTGMNLVDKERLRLFAALRATRLQTIVRLRLPTAMPMVLAGLEIAVVQALLGAVVAEFIAGQDGIGTQIVQMESVSNTAGIFAAIILLAVAGIVLHAIVRFARTKLIFWQSDGIEGE